jgi:TPR repeat protein
MNNGEQYEAGLAAFHRGLANIDIHRKLERIDLPDFQEAWKLLFPLAEDGVAAAQTLVACMYDLGLGTEPSAQRAAQWYELAANQGDAAAANNLCTLHQGGRLGRPPNEKEVRRWWKRTTELGFYERAPYPGDDVPI